MEQSPHRPDASLDFLTQLSVQDQHSLNCIGTRRIVAKNDFIFKAGQYDLNVYVMLSGRVKLYGSSVEGRDVLLWFSIAGEIFGLAEFMQEKPRQIYARAAERCEVLYIAQAPFKEWLASRPEVAFCLMKIMALRMRELGQRFLSLANGNIQMEIAQLLIRLGKTYGRLAGLQIHMDIPLTAQDIADMVGSSRQGVSTCLAQMKRDGMIDVAKHFLIIKKQEDMHKIATGQGKDLTLERRTKQRAWHAVQPATESLQRHEHHRPSATAQYPEGEIVQIRIKPRPY